MAEQSSPRWTWASDLGSLPSLSERFEELGAETPPLDEWVLTHRIIVGGSHPGPWQPRNARAAVEPMRAFSDRGVREVVIVAPTQLMKSEYAVSVVVYEAYYGRDVLFYEPAEDLLKEFMRDRIRPGLLAIGGVEFAAIESAYRKKRDSAYAIRYRGGGLITGLTPAHRTGRSGRTARSVVLDERDLMVGAHDMEQVARSRTTTYGSDAKTVILGTPTKDEPGTVWRAWKGGSRGEWKGRCVHCGKLSRVRWAQVHVPRGPRREWLSEQSALRCSECSALWTEAERLVALDRGAYIHEDPTHPHRTFWVPGPAHIWRSIEKIVRDGYQAYLDGANEHEWSAFERWTNEFRAEPWDDEHRGISSYRLGSQTRWNSGSRGEEDWGELHPETLLLTWGADVQSNAVHGEWVGWGWNPETERIRTWALRYAVLGGTPEDSVDDGEVWALVRSALLSTRFRLGSKLVGVQKGLIDCRFLTPVVRGWCEDMAREERLRSRIPGHRWRHFTPTILPYMSKAIEAGATVDLRSGVASVEKRKRIPAIVFANSSAVKDEQFESFQLDQRSRQPENLLPADAEAKGYDEQWRSEIASEIPVTVRAKSGAVRREWERKRGHGPNESWDCRIYARVAAMVLAWPRPLAEHLRLLYERGPGSSKIVKFPGRKR